jgi:hypothetical protein
VRGIRFPRLENTPQSWGKRSPNRFDCWRRVSGETKEVGTFCWLKLENA